jgi:hypothetical protein
MLQKFVLYYAPIAVVCLFIFLVIIKLVLITNVPTKDKMVLFLESFKMNRNPITSSQRKKSFYKKSDKVNMGAYILLTFILIIWLIMQLD